MRKVDSRFQRVRTQKMPGTGLVGLLPLEVFAPSVLAVEEAALRGLQQQPVWSGAVRQNIRVKLPQADLRSEQPAGSEHVPILCGGLIAALVEIGCRFLRRECVQPQ